MLSIVLLMNPDEQKRRVRQSGKKKVRESRPWFSVADLSGAIGDFNQTEDQFGPAVDSYFSANMVYMGSGRVVSYTALFSYLTVILTFAD
jgi:hypothetical protein